MGDFEYVPADKVTELLRKGKRCTEETAYMIWDRANIEQDYAKQLKKWSEKYGRKIDGPDQVFLHDGLLRCVKMLLREAEEKMLLHQQTYDCLLHQEGPYHRLIKYHNGPDSGRSFLVLPYTKMQSDTERNLELYKSTVDNQTRLLSTINKLNQRCETIKEELKILKETCNRKEEKYAKQGKPGTQLQKLRNQMYQKESYLEMTRVRWRDSLEKEVECREENKQKLEGLLKAIVKVEERRISFMIEQLVAYTDVLNDQQMQSVDAESCTYARSQLEEVDGRLEVASWKSRSCDVFDLPDGEERPGSEIEVQNTSSDSALNVVPPWITSSETLADIARLEDSIMPESGEFLASPPVTSTPEKRPSTQHSAEKIPLSRRSLQQAARDRPRMSRSSDFGPTFGRGNEQQQQHSVRSEQVLSPRKPHPLDSRESSRNELSNVSIDEDESRMLSELGAVARPVGSSRSSEPRSQPSLREEGPRLAHVHSELLKQPPPHRTHVVSQAAEGGAGLTDIAGATPADGDHGILRTQPINRRLRHSPGRLELNKTSPRRMPNTGGPLTSFMRRVTRRTSDVDISDKMADTENRNAWTMPQTKISAGEISFTEIEEFGNSDDDGVASESEYI